MAGAKIVKNKSTGYGYKYSNLADLAREGINIPKMRVCANECGEFIEYFDGSEWHKGARVIEFEAKGMNAAQAYGAALTYARRYTVQMAESIACDDDDAIEQASPAEAKSSFSKALKPTDKQLGYLKKLLKDSGKNDEEVESIIEQCKTSEQASKWIEKAKGLQNE